MLDTSISFPVVEARRWGRAGGAQRHGAAVPSGARGGAGRVGGHRGGPPVRRVSPERPRLDRPVQRRRSRRAGRPVSPPRLVPPPDARRDRSPHLRAAPGAPRVGATAPRAPPRDARRRPGAVALLDLPVPAPASFTWIGIVALIALVTTGGFIVGSTVASKAGSNAVLTPSRAPSRRTVTG